MTILFPIQLSLCSVVINLFNTKLIITYLGLIFFQYWNVIPLTEDGPGGKATMSVERSLYSSVMGLVGLQKLPIRTCTTVVPRLMSRTYCLPATMKGNASNLKASCVSVCVLYMQDSAAASNKVLHVCMLHTIPYS